MSILEIRSNPRHLNQRILAANNNDPAFRFEPDPKTADSGLFRPAYQIAEVI